MGLPKPSRETKFSGANADREKLIFPVQLTTCRMGNLTRLIHTLAICVTIHNVGDKPTVILYTTFMLSLFLTFSVLVANPKKLLYTVANPAPRAWSAEQGNVYSSVYAIRVAYSSLHVPGICMYGQHFQQSMMWINRVSLPVLLVDI